MSKRFERRLQQYRHTALATALAVGLGMTGLAHGQATTGSVFGTAPVSPGETVRIVNNQTGLTREVAVDSTGRFGANQLPVGDYTVSLMQGGNVIASRDHVRVSVAGGATVPFTAAEAGKNIQNLSSVTVTANSVPAIDVSSTRQTSVITAKDLKTLPLTRDAEAIAMLAPGVAGGNSGLGLGPAGTPLISFGGDSVVENAYYINGFNTTDPVGNAGGIALPYFAIAEQQTITSGYGAEYGRSTGGVINQVGQRGGNDFHAGVYATWAPDWAQSGYDNIYYANPLSPEYGQLQLNRERNSGWSQIYDAYLSGPLIKDTLFFYITAEGQHNSTQQALAGNYESYSSTLPKFYGKLDWNINDNNILELTGIQTKFQTDSDNIYNYSNATNTLGGFSNVNNPVYSSKFDIGILKYTSYITDNLTLSMLYGKMKSTYYGENEAYAGFNPNLAGIGTCSQTPTPAQIQNPAVPGYNSCNNNASQEATFNHQSSQGNFRLGLDWKLGNHDLKFGIDNVRSVDINDGTTSAGPGYYWSYGQVAPGTAPLTGSVATGSYVANPAGYPNGQTGYYVSKVVYGSFASFAVEQKAQYIEDNWQVTPNLLLNLGLRNDQYTNYNKDNMPYIRETSPQWQPRVGFSWDIFGDSTAKLYGNAGRYYLALPAGLGVRMAGANQYTNQYYTYGAINPDGTPVLNTLTPIYQSQTPYSSDGEYGYAKDPKLVASSNLKPMYQDEYVLGFQKAFNAFGQSLVWTSQATYSEMKDIVDDTGALPFNPAIGAALPPGADLNSVFTSAEQDVLVNPGSSNTLVYCMADNGAANPACTKYGTYTWNPKTQKGFVMSGFPDAFRKYYSLEESLEHPWDGKWMGKIDYVFSKSYGTTEGPTDSAIGQVTNASGASGGHQSGSITEAWDFPEIMQYSNGELPNSHRHTLKAYGTYAITPEWLVSGIYIVQSGAPISCIGWFGPDQSDPTGYIVGNPASPGAYHWCGGQPMPPGKAGYTPWTHQLNLSVSYIPAWAGKHLTLQVQVQNVFNEQKAISVNDFYGSTGGVGGFNPNPAYLLPLQMETESPRYAEFSVKYDW